MKRFTAAAALLASVAISAPAASTDYVTGTFGWFDVLDDNYDTGQFGLEWRAPYLWQGLRPFIGGNVTGDKSFYGYGGISYDFNLFEDIYLIPNFAIGAYAKGDGKDLGGTLEFRSGLEAAWEMPNLVRLGVAFNHVSNAGIYDSNPGAETLMLTVGMPLPTGR